MLPIKVGILGTGNIGTDLLMKISKKSTNLQVGMFAGIDPQSEGILRAQKMGIPTSAEGIQAILSDPSIKIVFDATSAGAHLKHAPLLKEAGMIAIDLTPAAVGPYVVPAVDMNMESMSEQNINMVTCGGQGTIPMVYAVSRVAEVAYGETVSTIPSKSAGPGTRANIDEFTDTTSKGVRVIGGAKRSKSIIILNPADPPILNRNTIYIVLEQDPDKEAIVASIEDMVRTVKNYVPGYRLKHPPVFEDRQITIMVEVEGAGDFLPKYAGNLDIMTSAALAAGEAMARKILNTRRKKQ
ncbi:acetaldehyde dehydrogenase (acetylating) [Desulfitobacterium sp.]|uniref:acetaldehyde dehydrogenase (acetylating) n=1 Tax=Desulfitobacterium sp. TaxID=49981 RepID=UPI002CA0583A|nr:acetaldehyde dehydrogenase (acetylating) [Desulfitobacterium sp.]HVJ49614.1 acetaldehyde dehydrogenase (acetylating) [Desulfitobacterium sp.]